LISMTVSPFRSTSRSTLYRTARWRVISGIFAVVFFLQTAFAPTLSAQAGRTAKTRKEPRALGLLELAPNGKARLIPITILIDGKYYDASAYKAAPVPMALWSDTVYEGIRTGVSMGLFTVTGALQRKQGDATEWLAEGTWQTASSIKAKAAKKSVSAVPRGINEDEGPPVLRRAGSEKPKPPESPAAPPAPAQPQPEPAPAATPQATPAPTASAPPAPATPSQSQAQEDQAPEDKDRPSLKRGKAGAESAAEAQKKAAADSAKPSGRAATASSTSPATTPGASSAQPAAEAANQIQLIPAISDSSGPDALPYTYNMKPEEEQQFRKKMLAMAADEIRARAAQLAPASTGNAAPVHAPSQHAKTTATKPLQPTFEDVQLRVFDLADINEPELVLTANARMPQNSRGPQGPDLQYIITLVVREDVNGELHKALANITDTQHLDVIPRLDLIDAVDVDGDGRGELLFRQVSDTGSSAFVIYRVIGDRLYPLFQGALGS
jgi:hypothetical protein